MTKKGWYGQSFRHKLAAKGVKTKRYYQQKTVQQDAQVGRAFEQLVTASAPGRAEKTLRESRAVRSLRKLAQEEELAGKPITIALQQVDAGDLFGALQYYERLNATEKSALQNAVFQKVLEREKQGIPVDENVIGILTERQKVALRGQIGRRTIAEIQTDLDAGNVQTALNALRGGELTIAEREAVQQGLNQVALQRAQSGIGLTRELLINIDPEVRKQVEQLNEIQQRQRKEQLESPVISALKEAVPGAVAESLETPLEGLQALAPEEKKFTGTIGRIDDGRPGSGVDVADSPFRTTNVVVGNEEEGFLSPLQGGVPRLSSGFDFLEEGRQGVNPVLQTVPPNQRPFFERVQDQINGLVAARPNLRKVDLSSYDEGNKAFKQGNREKLIDAINDLKREESKIKDRFTLVNQTHQNVVSRENYVSAFQKKGGNALFSLLEKGGDVIAKQTKQVNDVRDDLVKANQKAFSRRRMLELRLQRLDSTVPPETSVPSKVQRFEKPNDSSLFNVNNPVVDQLRGDKVA